MAALKGNALEYQCILFLARFGMATGSPAKSKLLILPMLIVEITHLVINRIELNLHAEHCFPHP